MPKRKTTKKKTLKEVETETTEESLNESTQNLDASEKVTKKTAKKRTGKSKKSRKSPNLEKIEEELPTPEEELEEEIKTINPTSDVVEVFDSENDTEWGFGYEFTKESDIKDQWEKVKKYFSKNDKSDLKFTLTWFSQDTEGFIPGEATKQYMIIWGWGYLINKIKELFTKNVTISNSKKIYQPSPDLSSSYWEDMPKIDEIIVNGDEIIPLPKKSPRRTSPVSDDLLKTVPNKIPRYWGPKKVNRSRDWLVPVISKKNFVENVNEPQDYLEEYIVEQVDFEVLKHPKTKKLIGIILTEEFDQTNPDEKYSLPERFSSFTPNFDLNSLNMGGNFGM
ncbi:MAG: hypothetical protein ACW981_03740 [Candidatus Hodarchaeales archaeon]